jgi:DNA-binding response OmpR family regulator
MHILIIEDDLDLGFALQQALRTEGITSEWLRRTNDAPRQLGDAAFDCVLLDLSLPDGSGFDLLKRWRNQGAAVPILIITARSALDDRLNGLDGGADDFLIKPFEIPELISRIRVVLRRSAHQTNEVWTFGTLQLEPRRYVARVDGETLNLSPREFHLLQELAQQAGKVVPKGELAQRLEPLGDAIDFAALEVHIFNLRRKIGAQRIRTVRGVGYMLES